MELADMRSKFQRAAEEQQAFSARFGIVFADWQVDVMRVGCAQNGSVPKDERGQVCALNRLTLPFGTAHIRSAGAALVARRLKIVG